MSPFTRHGDHLRLAIRLMPNAGRNRIEGVERGADGLAYVKAKVTAVPEDGKANKALIALLSDVLRLPKSSISILSGDTSRKKTLRIEGDPEDVIKRLSEMLEG